MNTVGQVTQNLETVLANDAYTTPIATRPTLPTRCRLLVSQKRKLKLYSGVSRRIKLLHAGYWRVIHCSPHQYLHYIVTSRFVYI